MYDLPCSSYVAESDGLMLAFRHNRECDAKLWFGELALNGFEQFIFNDEIMVPPIFDSYDDFIDHSWPEFVQDNSYM